MKEIKTNNIYLGDSYELIKQVPDKSVDLIITDPPYEFGSVALQSSQLHFSGIMKGRQLNPEHYVNQIKDLDIGSGIDYSILDDFVRVMKKINIYIWCNKQQILSYTDYFVKKLGCNWEIIIWAKQNPTPFCSTHYLKDKEYCLYFWETGVKLNIEFNRGYTAYMSKSNKEDKTNFGHPTIKPLNIIKNMVLNSSDTGGVILDTFLGSGTTAVAAKELGRQYIGFEINEKYYNIAKDRLNGISKNGQMSLLDTNFEQLDILGEENEK